MSRLQYWGLLLTCSVVSMLAIVTTLDKRNETKWERYERWIMSVTCISICVSFIGGLVSCLPPQQALKYEHPFVSAIICFTVSKSIGSRSVCCCCWGLIVSFNEALLIILTYVTCFSYFSPLFPSPQPLPPLHFENKKIIIQKQKRLLYV